MSHKTFFPKCGGGTFTQNSSCLIALFLLLMQLLPTQASAQIGSQCNEWAIEVCEAPLPYNTDAYGISAGCADNCYRVYYYFYLIKVGSQGNPQMEQSFTFTSLSLSGTLAVTPGDLSATGLGLSEVNVKESVSCSGDFPGLNNPGNPNSPILSYDATSNVFTYQVSSGDPTQPVLNWPVFGRLPLFVLAVDVFPNETVEPTGMAYSFTITNSSGSNPVTCNGVAQVCTNPLNFYKTIAQTTTSCNSSAGVPFFRIGDAVSAAAPGFPNRKKMPVWVYAPTSMNFSWDEADFLMSVATGQSMLTPTIETGLISADAVKVYSYPLGSGYRIYTHNIGTVSVQNGASAPNSLNTLFYIVFDGPQLESECAEATVAFTGHARLDGGDFICCKPLLGSANTASWGASNCVTDHCPEVTLRAVKNSTTQSNNCGSLLYFDLYISSTQNVNLTDVRCALKVKKNGTFSISAIETFSPFCSPSACISVTDISPDYLRVEYEATNLNLMLFSVGSPVLLATIALNTSDNGCLSGITFLDAVAQKNGAPDACLTSTQSGFSDTDPSDDACALGHIFQVSAETESGSTIGLWHYYINQFDPNYNNPSCEQTGISPDGQTISKCVCILPNTEQNVVLKKADNYLNGVSTFDLVLISRHILGIQPLTGFNILAADANMNGSVTTFDIVELRKLILGIYPSLPLANSWRFIDKDLKNAVQGSSNPFPLIHTPILGAGQPGNPNLIGGNQYLDITAPNWFANEEFDEFALPPTTNLNSKSEFVGFKVGDVNYSTIPSFNQHQTDDRAANVLTLGIKTVKGNAGESIEIPVFSLVQQSLVGWQIALGYDTNLLKIIGVRWPAEIPHRTMQDRGWHWSQPGELRILWFDGESTSALKSGTPLFFVQAELRQNLPNARDLLHSSSQNIPSEAYDSDMRTYSLQLEASDAAFLPVPTQPETQKKTVYRLSVYPNPAGAAFRLQVEASDACPVQLSIRDALGREVFNRSLDLGEGMNTLLSTQFPALSPGHYTVSLHTPASVETLRFVKQ